MFIDARVRICFRVSPFFFFRSPSLFPFSSYSQLGGITTVPTTPQQAHNNNKKKRGFCKRECSLCRESYEGRRLTCTTASFRLSAFRHFFHREGRRQITHWLPPSLVTVAATPPCPVPPATYLYRLYDGSSSSSKDSDRRRHRLLRRNCPPSSPSWWSCAASSRAVTRSGSSTVLSALSHARSL